MLVDTDDDINDDYDRCEVSEEAPMFATDSAYGDLLVVVTPKNGPSITGHNNRRYEDNENWIEKCNLLVSFSVYFSLIT